MSVQTLSSTELAVESDTEADLRLGNVAYDNEESKWVKCKAAAAIALGEVVIPDATAAVLNRTFYVPTVVKCTGIVKTAAIIGVAVTAIDSGDYFWAKVGPYILCLAGTTGSVATGILVYASATAGEVDDTVTGVEAGVFGVSVTASGVPAAGQIIVLRPV